MELPKGRLLPIELLPKGKLLPIVLLPKGVLLKGPPLVIPKAPLLAAEVVLLLVPAHKGLAGLSSGFERVYTLGIAGCPSNLYWTDHLENFRCIFSFHRMAVCFSSKNALWRRQSCKTGQLIQPVKGCSQSNDHAAVMLHIACRPSAKPTVTDLILSHSRL